MACRCMEFRKCIESVCCCCCCCVLSLCSVENVVVVVVWHYGGWTVSSTFLMDQRIAWVAIVKEGVKNVMVADALVLREMLMMIHVQSKIRLRSGIQQGRRELCQHRGGNTASGGGGGGGRTRSARMQKGGAGAAAVLGRG